MAIGAEPAGEALEVVPRIASLHGPAGFRVPETRGRSYAGWAVPRGCDPAGLALLLLNNPHVELRQRVTALAPDVAELAHVELEGLVEATPGSGADDFVGTPVAVRTTLRADSGAWVPLRLREHVRSWFSWVELPASSPDRAAMVVPEQIAAGLLRLPATTTTAFPGLAVEPEVVRFGGIPAAAGLVRMGVARAFDDSPVDIALSEEAMSRHVHVLGETGSGKSTLLVHMAIQTALAGQGLLFLDPHGKTVDRLLAELPPQVRDRVWVIRCADTANPVRLNPFALSDPTAREIVIGDLTEAFQQMFDPHNQGIVGPRFQRIMRRVLGSLSQLRGERMSLLDVPRVLEDPEWSRLVAKCVTSDELVTFWRNDILGNRSNEANEVIAWVTSKFTGFTGHPALRAMLETGADSFDPATAMGTNRIVLVDLAKGRMSVTGSRLIGLMYLLRFWAAAQAAPRPHPFTLFVDEAGSFSAVPLAAILAEGRKFGLRAVLAHQYLDQLNPDLVDAVAGSVATRAVFRVGHDDAQKLAAATLPEFGVLDLNSLPQFSAALRLADTGSAVRPFTLTVDHNDLLTTQPDAEAAGRAMRQRTIADLVDPHRGATRMQRSDLSPKEVGDRAAASSFVDDWLAARRRAAD